MSSAIKNLYGKTKVEKAEVNGKPIIEVAPEEIRFPIAKYCAGTVTN